MSHFLHVGFNTADPRISTWKPVFDKAMDWVRYAPNCWIIYTNQSPQTWYKRIKPQLKDEEHVFICELLIANRQGWLPNSIWEWINKPR